MINVAGHRLSTGQMEELIGSHPGVAECAVVGIDDELRGQVPVGFAVLKDGVDMDQQDLEKELVSIIRKEIGAVACFRKSALVKRLPKTRSGKIMRRLLRDIADGKALGDTTTLADPSVVARLQEDYADEQG